MKSSITAINKLTGLQLVLSRYVN